MGPKLNIGTGKDQSGIDFSQSYWSNTPLLKYLEITVFLEIPTDKEDREEYQITGSFKGK